MKLATLVTICAWCRFAISVRPDVEVSEGQPERLVKVDFRPGGTAKPEEHGDTVLAVVSHGCCGKCREDKLKELRAMPTAPTCSHGRASHEWCTACEAEV